MKIALIVLFAAALLVCPAAEAGRMTGVEYYSEEVPAPYLISPTAVEIDLTKQDELLFKWSPHESASGFREYYDFRLYKGYNMVESARIQKREIQPNSYQISLPSDIFEDGMAYTWSLRQVYSGPRTIKTSHASFKVIRKK